MTDSEAKPTGRSEHSEALQILERAGDNLPLGLGLQLSVFMVVGSLLMLLAPEAPWSIRLLVIALVFLTLKRWGGVLVLMLVQGDLLLREGREFPPLDDSDGILFVFVVLVVLMFVARNRILLQQIASGSVFSLARNLLTTVAEPTVPALPTHQTPVSDTGATLARLCGSALRGVTLLFCCVAVSRILLATLPGNRDLTDRLRSAVNADPAGIVGGIFIVLVVAAYLVVSEVSWRQMTAKQARMYLRSSFVKLHYRDLRMIVMRRLKLRQKRIAAATSAQKKHKAV